MITDLRPDLDRTSVDAYINGLTTELDKLYLSLERDSSLESRSQAKMIKKLRDYVRVTQVYPDKPRVDTEVPPRTEDPK